MRYENNERARSRGAFRTAMDVGMGLFYMAIGGILVFVQRIGDTPIPRWVAYPLGIIMAIGGAFRFYKGVAALMPQKKEE